MIRFSEDEVTHVENAFEVAFVVDDINVIDVCSFFALFTDALDGLVDGHVDADGCDVWIHDTTGGVASVG